NAPDHVQRIPLVEENSLSSHILQRLQLHNSSMPLLKMPILRFSIFQITEWYTLKLNLFFSGQTSHQVGNIKIPARCHILNCSIELTGIAAPAQKLISVQI